MANEAVIKLRNDDPIDFTVSDSFGIEKGTICKISGARIAAASDGSGDVFAGIAAREKIVSDGRTQLALFRRGIFDLVTGTAPVINAGQWVSTSGANLIKSATEAEVNAGKGIGIALEPSSASITTIEVMVGGY